VPLLEADAIEERAGEAAGPALLDVLLVRLCDLRPAAADPLGGGVREGEVLGRSERRCGMERPAGRHDHLVDRSLRRGRQSGLGHLPPVDWADLTPPPVSIYLCYEFNLTELILTS
jgi:hypothetical protein